MKDLNLQHLKKYLHKLSNKQKYALAGATVVVTLSFLLLLVWANHPDYARLYAKLNAAEAARVLADLQSHNIPYKLQENGSVLLVPEKDIAELRIRHAGENIISSSLGSSELLSQDNSESNDFMRRISLRRKLEGELTNTIGQIETINQARVHLALPESEALEGQEKQATASVVVKLKPNAELGRKQIKGIVNLVAASVEGLKPEDVTIIDTRGYMLTKPEFTNSQLDLTSTQYEMRKNVEAHLANKVQTMLEKVLGTGNAIVRVAVELNFDKIVRTSELVDPDNTAIQSEERNDESTANTGKTIHKRESTTTNYEINKVVEQFHGSMGDIKTLSVAVFVNGVFKNIEEPSVPRTAEEIDRITEIVKNTVGFNAQRNDRIEVQQLAFDRSFIDRENEIMATVQEREKIIYAIKVACAIAAVILLIIGLNRLIKKLGLNEYFQQKFNQLSSGSQTHLQEPDEQAAAILANARHGDGIQSKRSFQEHITKEVVRFSSEENEQAARILRYWLAEDNNQA